MSDSMLHEEKVEEKVPEDLDCDESLLEPAVELSMEENETEAGDDNFFPFDNLAVEMNEDVEENAATSETIAENGQDLSNMSEDACDPETEEAVADSTIPESNESSHDAMTYENSMSIKSEPENLEDMPETNLADFIYSSTPVTFDEGSNSTSDEAKEDMIKKPQLYRFPKVVKAVEMAEYETLQMIYQLLYQRSAWDTQEILKQRILEFSGFNFLESSEEYFNRDMMLKTQPNEVLVKIGHVLGLEQIRNMYSGGDKARFDLITAIMKFLTSMKSLVKPRRRTTYAKSSDLGIEPSPKNLITKCGCRARCLAKTPKSQRVAFLQYLKELENKNILDSYLYNLTEIKHNARKPGEDKQKFREYAYQFKVRFGTREFSVCKGGFAVYHGLKQRKLQTMQNKLKNNEPLPPKMDLNDFPPFNVPPKGIPPEEYEDVYGEDRVKSKRKLHRSQGIPPDVYPRNIWSSTRILRPRVKQQVGLYSIQSDLDLSLGVEAKKVKKSVGQKTSGKKNYHKKKALPEIQQANEIMVTPSDENVPVTMMSFMPILPSNDVEEKSTCGNTELKGTRKRKSKKRSKKCRDNPLNISTRKNSDYFTSNKIACDDMSVSIFSNEKFKRGLSSEVENVDLANATELLSDATKLPVNLTNSNREWKKRRNLLNIFAHTKSHILMSNVTKDCDNLSGMIHVNKKLKEINKPSYEVENEIQISSTTTVFNDSLIKLTSSNRELKIKRNSLNMSTVTTSDNLVGNVAKDYDEISESFNVKEEFKKINKPFYVVENEDQIASTATSLNASPIKLSSSNSDMNRERNSLNSSTAMRSDNEDQITSTATRLNATPIKLLSSNYDIKKERNPLNSPTPMRSDNLTRDFTNLSNKEKNEIQIATTSVGFNDSSRKLTSSKFELKRKLKKRNQTNELSYNRWNLSKNKDQMTSSEARFGNMSVDSVDLGKKPKKFIQNNEKDSNPYSNVKNEVVPIHTITRLDESSRKFTNSDYESKNNHKKSGQGDKINESLIKVENNAHFVSTAARFNELPTKSTSSNHEMTLKRKKSKRRHKKDCNSCSNYDVEVQMTSDTTFNNYPIHSNSGNGELKEKNKKSKHSHKIGPLYLGIHWEDQKSFAVSVPEDHIIDLTGERNILNVKKEKELKPDLTILEVKKRSAAVRCGNTEKELANCSDIRRKKFKPFHGTSQQIVKQEDKEKCAVNVENSKNKKTVQEIMKKEDNKIDAVERKLFSQDSVKEEKEDIYPSEFPFQGTSSESFLLDFGGSFEMDYLENQDEENSVRDTWDHYLHNPSPSIAPIKSEKEETDSDDSSGETSKQENGVRETEEGKTEAVQA